MNMKPGTKNSYNSLKEINIGSKNYKYFSLAEAEKRYSSQWIVEAFKLADSIITSIA